MFYLGTPQQIQLAQQLIRQKCEMMPVSSLILCNYNLMQIEHASSFILCFCVSRAHLVDTLDSRCQGKFLA